MPAFNAIIADSLPEGERGAGYGAYRTITSIPWTVSPLIGGYVMDLYGYEAGIKMFMYIAILVNIIVTYSRYRMLRETLDIDEGGKVSSRSSMGIKDSFMSAFSLSRSVKAMVVVAFLGSFGMQMVMNFLSVYVKDVLMFSNTQIGLVSTTGGLISMVLAMPGGMLADKFGRKPMILLSRVVSPLSYLGVTMASSFQQYYNIMAVNSIGNALGGGGMYAGGPAWNALLADLVPRDRLAMVMGTIGTLSGLMAIPSPIIGGWMWDEYSPKMPFYASVVFGVLSAGIFLIGVQEKRVNNG